MKTKKEACACCGRCMKNPKTIVQLKKEYVPLCKKCSNFMTEQDLLQKYEIGFKDGLVQSKEIIKDLVIKTIDERV